MKTHYLDGFEQISGWIDCPLPLPEAPKRRSVAHAMQTVFNGNPSGGGTGSETGTGKIRFSARFCKMMAHMKIRHLHAFE